MRTLPTAFDPTIPTLTGRALDEVRRWASELLAESAFLGRKPTVKLSKHRRFENARASNAIECVDQPTVVQAHIEVETLVDRRIQEARASGKNFDPMDPELFLWLHGEFYRRMPAEFRRMGDESIAPVEIIPGELRDRMVAVGNQWCPEPAALPGLLEHFHDCYRLDRFNTIEEKLIAVVASHSRFEWIHPFLDGNGRVGRLALHAALSWVLPCAAWWPVSTGFEREREGYLVAIAHSHWARAHDTDGRGPLSERELIGWCRFVLENLIGEIQRRRESNLYIGMVMAGARIDRQFDLANQYRDLLIRLVLSNGGHLPNTEEIRRRVGGFSQAVLERIEAIIRDSLGFRS